MKVYYWQCGHRTTTTAATNRSRGRIVCPICKSGYCMVARAFCDDCGADIGFFPPEKRSKKYCRECVAQRDYESKRRYDAARCALKVQKRYSDCIHYQSECLPKAAFKNTSMDCTGCPRYVAMESNVMAYASVRDSFSRTITHAMPRI